MPLGCWHISAKVFDKLDEFFQMDTSAEDAFFLMFAHGYEISHITAIIVQI